MTDEDKKLVFEYMGWRMPCDGNEANRFACLTEGEITCIKCEYYHPLDGNDMVAAMNKMRFSLDKEFDNEWQDFFYSSESGGIVADSCFELCSNPTRFFELMSSWLKEKEHVN